jgi:hypothetical protein
LFSLSDLNIDQTVVLATDGKFNVKYKVEDLKFKCAGCQDYCTSSNCIVENRMNSQILYFCLNCDEWIKDKSKVLDKNWTFLEERET